MALTVRSETNKTIQTHVQLYHANLPSQKMDRLCLRISQNIDEIFRSVIAAKSSGATFVKKLCTINPKYKGVLQAIIFKLWAFTISEATRETYCTSGWDHPVYKYGFECTIAWPGSDKPCGKGDFSMFLNDRVQQLFTDVTLSCAGQTYPVHRIVLSARSDYIKEVLANEMNGSFGTTFEVDAPVDHLSECIDFLYTGKVDLKGRTIEEIEKFLVLAERFKVRDLQQACSFELFQQITEDNLVRIDTIGQRFKIRDLFDFCSWRGSFTPEFYRSYVAYHACGGK
jgi:hypothetical protein